MLPLILVYFAEYLINQGIAPVLKFPGSLADGREYVYYQVPSPTIIYHRAISQ
jgi:hypothetical protein